MSNIVRLKKEETTEITYMGRALVQATLPHRAPPDDLPIWSRVNGNLTLSIRPGWDSKNNKSLGYPYGIIPRLLLFWITTEALRTGSRRIELGKSLSDFMRSVGLNPSSGTGPRSDAHRLRKQMEKLFRATISLEIQGGVKKDSQSWLDMQIAPIGEFWWNTKLSDENAIFKSWVELGEKFYSSILNNPVPLDMEALKALRHSPLALDLYAWASYKTYSLIRSHKHLNVTWEELAMQLGAEYGRMIDFKRSALRALVKVQEVYQGLRVSESDDGLILKPGSLSVPQKSQIPSPKSLFKIPKGV